MQRMKSELCKAVFLDRDGTINKLVTRFYDADEGMLTSPWRLSEFEFMPNAEIGIEALRSYGYKIFIVTNQPGMQDGDMLSTDYARISVMLKEKLKIDDIYTAWLREHPSYKPGNAGIEHLISKHGVDRTKSYMVGDRWKDIVPGHISGLTTIHIGFDYSTPPEFAHLKPHHKVRDLLDAAWIIKAREALGKV